MNFVKKKILAPEEFRHNTDISEIKGMYALQFGPSEVSASESYPIWLTGDEIMYVTAYASHNKYVESKQYVQDYEEDEDNFEDMIKDPGDKKSDA